eukprot:1188162-Prorocentrum_minimum.AAC.1
MQYAQSLYLCIETLNSHVRGVTLNSSGGGLPSCVWGECIATKGGSGGGCLLYTSPSPRDAHES